MFNNSRFFIYLMTIGMKVSWYFYFQSLQTAFNILGSPFQITMNSQKNWAKPFLFTIEIDPIYSVYLL